MEGAQTPRTHQASDWRALIGEGVVAIWPDLAEGPLWIESQVHVESLGDPPPRATPAPRASFS